MKEYELQKAVCKYLDLQGYLYCGSMGGNYQPHVSVRMRAKKSGYKRGFPDLFIYEPVGKFHGLAIELKVGKNRATKEQLKWRDELNKRGYVAEICHGLDNAISVIETYLGGFIE
jgi:hypothetical protein|tara:strand:+ start:185 stop:529 length:345 start_codon:yes stop_codon:yes gene_type:complete